MILYIRERPDRDGKWKYDLYWLADYHPGDPEGEHRLAWRGQCFHAPLPEKLRRDR